MNHKKFFFCLILEVQVSRLSPNNVIWTMTLETDESCAATKGIVWYIDEVLDSITSVEDRALRLNFGFRLLSRLSGISLSIIHNSLKLDSKCDPSPLDLVEMWRIILDFWKYLENTYILVEDLIQNYFEILCEWSWAERQLQSQGNQIRFGG